MAQYYTTARLSPSIWETPEGFLVCGGVAITRTGDLEYRADEVPGADADNGMIVLTRTENDIFDPLTIASFEGKPVTNGHHGFINADNWRQYAVGTVQNVRRGQGDEADKLLADLLITDAESIAAVRSGTLREVSCGYDFELIETAPGRGAQQKIRGNHVALVESGRAGPECRIQDSKPKGFTMKKIKDLLRRAADEMPDEPEKEKAGDEEMDVAAVLKSIMARLDRLEGKAEDADPEEEEKEKASDEEGKATDPEKERKAADSKSVKALDARLALIEDGLARLLETQVPVKYSAADAARAEILAPGVAHTADMKKKAVLAAYATEDGKAAIDKLLDGQPLSGVKSFDGLFLAAATALEVGRRGVLPQAGRAGDGFSGAMTAEKLNELNRKHYGRAV